MSPVNGTAVSIEAFFIVLIRYVLLKIIAYAFMSFQVLAYLNVFYFSIYPVLVSLYHLRSPPGENFSCYLSLTL